MFPYVGKYFWEKITYLTIHAIVIILFFLYFYNVKFSFSPFTSRQLLTLIGFLLIPFIKINKKYNYLITLMFLLLLFTGISVFSSYINFSSFITLFLKLPISFLTNLLACIFLIFIYNSRIYDHKNIIKVILLAILLHNILSLLMYQSNFIKDLIYSIVDTNINEGREDLLKSEKRFLGIGEGSFFGGAVINSIGLILNSYIILSTKGKKRIIWSFIWIFLLFSGFLIARTTLIGGIIGGVFLFNSINRISSKIAYLIISIIVILVSFYVLMNFFPNELRFWALEFYYRYKYLGKIETASTNALTNMYIFPNQFSTLIIGDGKLTDPNGSYYMGTDVGWLRILFATGLIGVFAYLSFFWYFHRILAYHFRDYYLKKNFLFLFILFFALNLKGFTSFIPYIMPFFAYILIKFKHPIAI